MNDEEHINAQIHSLHIIISRMRANAAQYGLKCRGENYRLALKLLDYYQSKRRPGIVWTVLGPLSLLKEFEGPYSRICDRTCQYEVTDCHEPVGVAVRCYRSEEKLLDRKSLWVFVPSKAWKVGQIEASSLTELQKVVLTKAKIAEAAEE